MSLCPETTTRGWRRHNYERMERAPSNADLEGTRDELRRRTRPAQDERHVVEKEKAAARYSERPLKSVPYYKQHPPLGASRAYRYQARRSELICPMRKPGCVAFFFLLTNEEHYIDEPMTTKRASSS